MDYITSTEAAAIIGVSVRRIQAMIRQKTLPARKFGREWMILKADAEWLKEQERRPGWRKNAKPPSST